MPDDELIDAEQVADALAEIVEDLQTATQDLQTFAEWRVWIGDRLKYNLDL